MAGQRNPHSKRRFDYSDSGSGGGAKRRYSDDLSPNPNPNSDPTLYRYLCPARRIGSILGRGGEIAKQLRAATGAKLNIGETVANSDERVITLISWPKHLQEPSETLETSMETEPRVSPAQDALIRVHEKVTADETTGGEGNGGAEEGEAGQTGQVVARMLVPSDQIGCVIGKGGAIVQAIRAETGAQIRIMKDDRLPACALPGDELLQILGDASTVKKALTSVAARLQDNPSQSSVALAQGSVRSGRDTWQEPPSHYPRERDYPVYAPRDEYSAREFSLKIVCNSALIGGVIGKGGGIINQIRQESRASIKVETEPVEEECVIVVSAREFFEDMVSPTIDAAVRLQPRCSAPSSSAEAPNPTFTTRLLVPSARVGCLLGKGGNIITDMRRTTGAGIKVVAKDHVPKVADLHDEMVQISGELDVARHALIQVATRLKANFFERESDLGGLVPPPVQPSVSPEPSRYSGRYGGGYAPAADVEFGRYESQAGGSSYGGYGGYSRRSDSNGR